LGTTLTRNRADISVFVWNTIRPEQIDRSVFSGPFSGLGNGVVIASFNGSPNAFKAFKLELVLRWN